MPLIQPLHNQSYDVCGCFFVPAAAVGDPPPFVFLSGLDSRARMNLGGTDLEFAEVQAPAAPYDEVGDAADWVYESPHAHVTLHAVVTGKPSPEGEVCQSTPMNGWVTVTTRERAETLAITGDCGC
jgi:hypothetical protein